jgi:hypothetical protein
MTLSQRVFPWAEFRGFEDSQTQPARTSLEADYFRVNAQESSGCGG